MMNVNYSLYFCSDEKLMQKLNYATTIEKIIENGFTIIQLRLKTFKKNEMIKIIKKIKKITDKHNIPLIINDHWKLAKKLKCAGIHLGQNDTKLTKIRKKVKDFIIGISCENLKQAQDAQKNGANYVSIGSIFPTKTKQDVKVVGLQNLKKIVNNITIPVVAIGGINKSNFDFVKKTNVDGIAMISEILKNNEIKKNIITIKSI